MRGRSKKMRFKDIKAGQTIYFKDRYSVSSKSNLQADAMVVTEINQKTKRIKTDKWDYNINPCDLTAIPCCLMECGNCLYHKRRNKP
jgi:hypothetical protein